MWCSEFFFLGLEDVNRPLKRWRAIAMPSSREIRSSWVADKKLKAPSVGKVVCEAGAGTAYFKCQCAEESTQSWKFVATKPKSGDPTVLHWSRSGTTRTSELQSHGWQIQGAGEVIVVRLYRARASRIRTLRAIRALPTLNPKPYINPKP